MWRCACFFFFNDTATTEIYTLSLHDALPISDRAQRNFTDPDSRIQPTRDGFVQGYNAQAAVDAESQVVVAQRLVSGPADYPGLVPLIDQVRDRCGRHPRKVSADAGFCTEANLAAVQERRIAAYMPPRRARHGEASPARPPPLKAKPPAMAHAAKPGP